MSEQPGTDPADTPPTHCPYCGQPTPHVRKVISNLYELYCHACNRFAIVVPCSSTPPPTTYLTVDDDEETRIH